MNVVADYSVSPDAVPNHGRLDRRIAMHDFSEDRSMELMDVVSKPISPDGGNSMFESLAVGLEFACQDLHYDYQEDVAEEQQDKRSLQGKRFRAWAASFRRTDPRFRILKFFDDVAQEGAKNVQQAGIRDSRQRPMPRLLRLFQRASVFTVWRPTSLDAIRKMMKGEAVGKGLDIKGKSARSGNISGFVPFLQIHKEKHKRQVRTLPKDAAMRIYYQNEEHRNRMASVCQQVAQEMTLGFSESQRCLADPTSDDQAREWAFECFAWEMENPKIELLDDFADSNAYGLEIPERLFWEVYVMRQDISRRMGSFRDTKRASQPAFQDMNFQAMRHYEAGKPRPVVWQFNAQDPTCPQDLLVAYEEAGRVKPVVSDFDCFLVGTRGVTYQDSLPRDQREMLEWCVQSIGTILDTSSGQSWTTRWLEHLKQHNSTPEIPEFGFADPKSYAIMKSAVDRLKDDGCVRHGSESFNYYFPQELDNEFLVISDTLPGNVQWKYVNVKGLQDILKLKIEQGYTFPLNPKWILCDSGWKDIYDRLLSSDRKNVQDSVNIWFPQNVRDCIENLHARHPYGFNIDPFADEEPVIRHGRMGSIVTDQMNLEGDMSGTLAMDLAEDALERYRTLSRAKTKMRVYIRLLGYLVRARKTASLRQDTGDLRRSFQIGGRRSNSMRNVDDVHGSIPLDTGTPRTRLSQKSLSMSHMDYRDTPDRKLPSQQTVSRAKTKLRVYVRLIGCMARAKEDVTAKKAAAAVANETKSRPWYDHPDFIAPRVKEVVTAKQTASAKETISRQWYDHPNFVAPGAEELVTAKQAASAKELKTRPWYDPDLIRPRAKEVATAKQASAAAAKETNTRPRHDHPSYARPPRPPKKERPKLRRSSQTRSRRLFGQRLDI